MIATQIEYANFEQFISREPVSTLLCIDSRDSSTCRLLKRLADVSDEFSSGISFGWIDIASLTETEISEFDCYVTPSLQFFRGRQLVENATETGYHRTAEALCRSNIMSCFGKTDGNATLIR